MPLQTPILDKYFHDFMVSCFGPDYMTRMPEFELTERQRTFFSGFASYHFFAIGINQLSDKEAEDRLRALSMEIKSFFAQIKNVPKDLKGN